MCFAYWQIKWSFFHECIKTTKQWFQLSYAKSFIQLFNIRHIQLRWQVMSTFQISPPEYLKSIYSGETLLKTMFLETLMSIWFIIHAHFWSDLLCYNSTCRFGTRFCSEWKQQSWRWRWQRRQDAVASSYLTVITTMNRNANNDICLLYTSPSPRD